MSKPERRQSKLTNMSAVVPQSAPAAAPAGAQAAKRTKVAYYVEGDGADRIRAAFVAGRNTYGWRSFSEFQVETMLARVEKLEQELNGGQAFEGVPPKAAQLGRPLD